MKAYQPATLATNKTHELPSLDAIEMIVETANKEICNELKELGLDCVDIPCCECKDLVFENVPTNKNDGKYHTKQVFKCYKILLGIQIYFF